MLQRDEYLLLGSTEVGEEEALSSTGVIKKQSRLERCVAAGRNPLSGLLWPFKLVSIRTITSTKSSTDDVHIIKFTIDRLLRFD